ncbi:MAG: hypothetical protein J6S28_01045 [Clostridia bacterium]|nr:hypothetical protein [Clostridia bacterium]
MENKQLNTNMQDEGRIAHMIAWRDKRISMLQDMLGEMEQANTIYAAYIAYLLERCSQGAGGQIRVAKQDIRRVCGKFTVCADQEGDDYVITLLERSSEYGKQCSQMADA